MRIDGQMDRWTDRHKVDSRILQEIALRTVYNVTILLSTGKLRKGLLASSCPYVRMEQLWFRWTDFHEILNLSMCIFECVWMCACLCRWLCMHVLI
jgi:hypothetical protein